MEKRKESRGILIGILMVIIVAASAGYGIEFDDPVNATQGHESINYTLNDTTIHDWSEIDTFKNVTMQTLDAVNVIVGGWLNVTLWFEVWMNATIYGNLTVWGNTALMGGLDVEGDTNLKNLTLEEIQDSDSNTSWYIHNGTLIVHLEQ